MIGNVFDLLRKCEVRIPFEVTGLQHHLLNVIAIGADELTAETIEGLAELSSSGRFVELIGAGAKTAINAVEKDDRLLRMGR